ncbi:MAG TPA: alpha-glucosidase C-terminal domain-containing protein, partial [Candidatus Dormibacteraeota bacterium]|nr:alpha-glucosidase C-terminal domain-containing protein [Candidatus Dormibacteraeota bacterium]
DIAKLMAAMYLTLRGSAIMYYGEEIGMENNVPKNKEDVQDPIGKLGWPLEKGRDGERTPMQWTNGTNAGFSKTKPWLPVPASAKTHNVETESKDPDSVLNFYRQLLAMRHKEPALLEGDYLALNEDDPNVFSYLRRYKGEAILVVLNMSNSPQNVRFDFAPAGFAAPKLQVLLSNAHAPVTSSADGLALQPFSAFVAKVTQ